MVRTTSRRSLRALLSVVALSAVAACTLQDGGAGERVPVVDGNEVQHAESGGSGAVTEHSATIDGLERTWTTYTPAGLDRQAAPLLIVLHGTGDTGGGIRSGVGPDFEALADEQGFAIAYVDGYQNNWNECRREGDWPAKERGLDDVGLIREIPRMLGTGGQVYAVGFSSGGHMAMRLALEAPDLVDGVGVVAANPPAADNQACDLSGGGIPVIFVEGREDAINPIDGGEVVVGSGLSAVSRGDVLSAIDGAQWFAEKNGAGSDSDPSPVRDGAVETTTWQGADPVRLVVLDGVGHSFPTLSGRWGRDGGTRYDAPGEIWEYLSGH